MYDIIQYCIKPYICIQYVNIINKYDFHIV